MSRIKEFKRIYPLLDKSFIDVINEAIPLKYQETFLRLVYDRFLNEKHNNYFDIEEELTISWGLPDSYVVNKTFNELIVNFGLLDLMARRDEIKTIYKFAELNDKKLIKNNDLRSYKSFIEMDLQISIAQIKQYDKELEKEIELIFEDEVWKVLKPLSWVASKKYGSGTKWCTSMEKDVTPFIRYVRRGILVYAINKQTGLKVAGFKNLDLDYEKETSFWNEMDQRVDSMELNIPNFILDMYRVQFTSCQKTNWELFTQESKNSHFKLLKKDVVHPTISRIEDELEHELTRRVVTPFSENSTQWDLTQNNTNVA